MNNQQQRNELAGLKAFYDYWAELYGTGLMVANWHQNGDLESFDNFFDSAEELIGGNDDGSTTEAQSE